MHVIQIFTKGAPEVVLPRCKSILTSEGEKTLGSDELQSINETVSAMERKSQLKVICLASRIRKEPIANSKNGCLVLVLTCLPVGIETDGMIVVMMIVVMMIT